MSDTSYTYLGLTNKVLLELNEVTITDAAEFGGVSGFHESVKGYINDALESIFNEEDNRWPFQKTDATVTLLTDGSTDYALSANSADTDWDSFFIQKNLALTIPQDEKKLPNKPYTFYRDWYRAEDKNRTSDTYSCPDYVVRLNDNKIAVSPPANQAYTLKYEYYTIFTPLTASTDVPLVPERYRRAIIEYAKMLAYDFRDNAESADLSQKRAEKIVNQMRRDLIPQQDTVVAAC